MISDTHIVYRNAIITIELVDSISRDGLDVTYMRYTLQISQSRRVLTVTQS